MKVENDKDVIITRNFHEDDKEKTNSPFQDEDDDITIEIWWSVFKFNEEDETINVENHNKQMNFPGSAKTDINNIIKKEESNLQNLLRIEK